MVRRFLPITVLGTLAIGVAACGAEPEGDMDSAAEAEAPEAAPGAIEAAPEQYSVAYENDVVRVLDVSYEAGEEVAMHHHPPHCWVVVEDSEWRMSAPDGTSEVTPFEHGTFGCAEEPMTHAPANVGDGPARVVLFEMKEGGSAGDAMVEGADAVEVDPAHYTVEYENDAVRVLRIAYDPGDSAVEHGHPANCIVWLDVPEGEDVGPGDIECSDASVHTPEPTGEVELIAIEFKGRQTAQ